LSSTAAKPSPAISTAEDSKPSIDTNHGHQCLRSDLCVLQQPQHHRRAIISLHRIGIGIAKASLPQSSAECLSSGSLAVEPFALCICASAAMAQQHPATPVGGTGPSIFGGPGHATTGVTPQLSVSSFASTLTPASAASAASSNNTYIMPNSPLKNRAAMDGYRPKVTRTLGQRPACLVNASVTYCGNNRIYAFGGFDQYTDEVYNHVLRLDLISHQWTLVDNYGDIPGVRMGKFPGSCACVSPLTAPRRAHGNPVQRRQASGFRRRERAPDLPFRSHHIRPQDRALDTASSNGADPQGPRSTCCRAARGQALHRGRHHWTRQLRVGRYMLSRFEDVYLVEVMAFCRTIRPLGVHLG
jgi:hypothetical protein